MARAIDPNRRQEILAAARAIFTEYGFVQTRMADIARCAGIAPGTIYLYFDSKEAITLALADQFFVRLNEQMLPAFELADVSAFITEAVRAVFAFSTDEQELLKFTRISFGPASQIQRLPAQRAFYTALTEHLAARIERGEIRPYDPHTLADIIAGMIERAIEIVVRVDHSSTALREQTIIDLLHHALLPSQ